MRITRRGLAGLGAAGLVTAAAGWRLLVDKGPDAPVPDAPVGDERLELRDSAARGKQVHFYTAVPDGHGDGRGLPVCLILHGASATAADFPRFGFGRFLTDAVRRGAHPFVLAGATGDRLAWSPRGADDPRRMLREELPAWCAERGFDTARTALWGWSMGGYGALLYAASYPGSVRAVAAFSPAVSPGDAVFAARDRLAGTPVGLWCGRDDELYPAVRDLAGRLPQPPRVAAFSEGRHTRGYWNGVTPAAFAFVAAALTS